MGISSSTDKDKATSNNLLDDKSMKSQAEHKCSQMNMSIELEPKSLDIETEKTINTKPLTQDANQQKTNTRISRRHSISFKLPRKLKSKLKSKLKTKTMSMDNIDKFVKFVREKHHKTSRSEFEMFKTLDPELTAGTATTTDDFLLISTSSEDTSDNETSVESSVYDNENNFDYLTDSNESVEMSELWVFNMCLWSDEEVEQFLKLIGSEKYIDIFKSNDIKANHLRIINKQILQSMDIPIIHCEKIVRERDWFLKCNQSIQTLRELNVTNCNKNRLKTILKDIKPILVKIRSYSLREHCEKTIFETKHKIMAKIIKDHIQEIENQLNV